MKWLENSLVYKPYSADQKWEQPPGPDVADVWFTATDGTAIHAWWLPRPTGTGAVLVCHGNAGNLSHGGWLAEEFRTSLGRPVLIFDYPGYGKSGGKPTEAGCYAAGEAALRWLADEQHIPAGRVVLFGESLGGGVATELATRHDHEALVLAKTFTSLPAVAKKMYPWLPTHTLMSNRFDNLSKLPRCKGPVFITHGTMDQLVPFAHGEALFAVANEPKEFCRLTGEDHNDPLGGDFLKAVKGFLDRVRR